MDLQKENMGLENMEYINNIAKKDLDAIDYVLKSDFSNFSVYQLNQKAHHFLGIEDRLPRFVSSITFQVRAVRQIPDQVNEWTRELLIASIKESLEIYKLFLLLVKHWNILQNSNDWLSDFIAITNEFSDFITPQIITDQIRDTRDRALRII